MGGTSGESDLVKLSTFQVWQIKVISLVLGLWFLCKRTLKKLVGYKSVGPSIEKPPSCLTDSSIGVHSYIKLKGIKFHYLDSGKKNGGLVVLLHGFPDCWISWRHQIPVLSPHYRVIAVDLKGFGDSDKPEGIQQYNIEVILRELHDLVLTLGYKRCIMIGHDMGALIGWFFMHFYEDMVIKFVSVAAPHPNMYWKAIAESKSNVINSRWVQFCQLPYLPEMMAMDDDLKFLNDVYTHLKVAEDGQDILAAYKYAFSRREDWTGAINHFRTLPFWKLGECRRYAVNTLFIVGNQDSRTLLENVVVSADHYFEKFSVKLIDNAGHYPHHEKPSEFNQFLINFLIGVPATSPTKVTASSPGLVNRLRGAVSSTYEFGTGAAAGVFDIVNKRLPSSLVPVSGRPFN